MKTCIALSAVLLAACSTTTTPDYDQRFGDAVRQARMRQTLNPTASANPDPVLGVDGKAAQESINLKFVSEASELQQTGSPFTSFNNVTAILPSMATRRVDTTVQLRDGQSFMVAGLIKNNLTSSLDKFPGLGEVPVMGALFRSTEFQNDQSELMFIVTPRLVKPMNGPTTLPTQNHIAPTRGGVMWEGRSEGLAPPPAGTQP